MAGQLGGRAAARQAGWLVGWLAGWLADWSVSAVAALMFTAANGWASQLLVGPTRRPLKAWSKRVSTGAPPQPAGWPAGRLLAVRAERACVMQAACVALTLTQVRGLKITNRLCGCRFFFGVIFFFLCFSHFFYSFFFSFMMKPNYRSRRRKNLEDFIQANFFCFCFVFSQEKNHYIFVLFVCLD